MKVKKVLSTILTLSMVFTLIPSIPPITTQASATINIGDYVQMGSYYDEPILWRCVDIDENGPLMLADRILTIKPFDAAGNHKYLDGTSQADSSGYRTIYGSNLWETSNLRSWLNSSEAAGNVTWLDGCPPTADKVCDGLNDYATEKGFLAEGNFTISEKNAIKSVTQKSLLNDEDVSKLKVGGTTLHTLDYYISTVVQNYDTAYYQNVTDKMFLLDIKQINKVYQNSATLGANYHITKPTPKAVENSEYKSSGLSSELCCNSWSRTPCASSSNLDGTRYISEIGNISNYFASTNNLGTRPAFYINLSSVVFKSGNGSIGTPYVVMNGNEPTPTAIPTPTATSAPTATPTLTPDAILTVGSVYGAIENQVFDERVHEQILVENNVNVSVNISANSGLATGSYILHYDTTKLDIVTATSGSVLDTLSPSVTSNDTDGTVNIEFSGDHGISSEGSVLDLTFKIKYTSGIGTVPLILEVVDMKNDNSDAITYSIIQGAINVYLLGDVTGDGKVATSDALKIVQAVSGKIKLTDAQKAAADVTKNGLVQASDALKVLQFCSGRICGF